MLISQIQKFFHQREKIITIKKDIQNIQLDSKKSVICGLCINEILTNAYKYAFAGKKEGSIEIKLSQEDDKINLFISDDGIGLKEELNLDKADSLGIYLIKTIIEKQLDGNINSYNENGLKYKITFPLK